MCYERYMRRRRDQAEESRGFWMDFERTTPISDPEPPEVTEPDVTEPERAETVTVADQQ
jgi:hypothetical protein